jgi:hypothetical protein
LLVEARADLHQDLDWYKFQAETQIWPYDDFIHWNFRRGRQATLGMGQEVLSQIDNTPQSGNNGVSLGSGGSGAISSGTGSGAAGGVAQMGSSSYGNTHNQQGS